MKTNQKPIIIIEAGHSITAPGAIAYDGTTEHELNVEFQKGVVSGHDCTVLSGSSFKPATDHEELTLRSTINLINSTRNCQRVLSIHFNNNNPNTRGGVEAFVSPRTSVDNRLRAEYICEGLSKIIGIPNRGVKTPAQSALGRLAIIQDTKPPIILLEVCFVNNTDLPKYRAVKKQCWDFVKFAMFVKTFTT